MNLYHRKYPFIYFCSGVYMHYLSTFKALHIKIKVQHNLASTLVNNTCMSKWRVSSSSSTSRVNWDNYHNRALRNVSSMMQKSGIMNII
mmetsp:Transcript_24430/g.37701  ORF Transcript_24430/g.37701 Transcript_24430/m.37701 type:complete len:89 (+) Transcript_24430:1446-1712(+)